MNDSKSNQDEWHLETEALFAASKRTNLEPSPYLRTRVLAEIPGVLSSSTPIRSWSWNWRLSLGAASACILAIAIFQLNNSRYDGVVSRDMLLKISAHDSGLRGVSAMRVELPDGVDFYTTGLPELEGKRVLTLNLDSPDALESLPVVIHANETGLKKVKVIYLDNDYREIGAKPIPIRFRQPVGEEKRL